MQPLPALLPALRSQLVAALLMVSWCAAVASPVDGEELRVIDGRYVRIVTDLPPGEATDQLAAAFDAAVPRWCAYWDVALAEVESWRVTAYVMVDREGFLRRRLLPKNLPEFPHGYQAGERVWLMAQPSDYYTRHLLLHEGVHAIAERLFGAAGPPWFAEGTAELLATHRWDGRRVELPVVPDSREAFPYWGRFKLLDERRETGEALSLEAIFRYRGTARRQVEPYAWSWAATAMLDAYPDSQLAVRNAARRGRDRSVAFTDRLRDDLSVPWHVMRARWRILIDEFDYGYDLQRNRVELDPAPPEWDGQPLQLEIAADRGWQAAPIRLSAGASVRIEAEGRYQIGTAAGRWACCWRPPWRSTSPRALPSIR
jgi:hypothetical protein